MDDGTGAELGGKSEISVLNSGSSGFHHLPFPLPTHGEKESLGPPQADTWEELMCLGCDLAAQSNVLFILVPGTAGCLLALSLVPRSKAHQFKYAEVSLQKEAP